MMKLDWDAAKNRTNQRRNIVSIIGAIKATDRKKVMKKEYDLTKLKKRPKKATVDKNVVKTQISLRVDGSDLSDIRAEADRLGIPYQTFISSILHRYATGDLIDRKSPEIKRLMKTVS